MNNAGSVNVLGFAGAQSTRNLQAQDLASMYGGTIEVDCRRGRSVWRQLEGPRLGRA